VLISEIFYSIQGEGELTGVPSVFVRTSGCNLRCAWCDTPYASWNPEGEQRTVDSIVAEVQGHASARHVVLTGGEPMIAKEIGALAAELKMLGYHITIETAATVPPDGNRLRPRLAFAEAAQLRPRRHRARGVAQEARGDPLAARCRARVARRLWLAVQICRRGAADVDELEGMLASLGRDIPRHKVLLMPEATTLETMRQRANWLSETCKTRGYRYAHRLHIELYGNRRGT